MADLEKLPDDDPRARLRASDADRQAVAQILGNAAAQGKLTFSEYDDRLQDVWKATTYGELDVLIGDVVQLRHQSSPRQVVGDGPAKDTALAVLGGFERKGDWIVPARFNAVAFWGGGVIDLRQARFAAPQVEIVCTAIMGGIEVIVDENTPIEMRGTAIMGGFDHHQNLPVNASPRVVVSGFTLMGGVSVHVKKAKKS